MKKRIIMISVVILLCSILIAEAVIEIENRKDAIIGNIERITNYDRRILGALTRMDSTVMLSPAETWASVGYGRGGESPRVPKGLARIRSSKGFYGDYGYPISHMELTTMYLIPSYLFGGVYRVYALDEETDYRLLLGNFETGQSGVGQLLYDIEHYFNNYDKIEVRAQPYDYYGFELGPLVMIGSIPKYYDAYYGFNPEPKSSLMIGSSVKKFD